MHWVTTTGDDDGRMARTKAASSELSTRRRAVAVRAPFRVPGVLVAKDRHAVHCAAGCKVRLQLFGFGPEVDATDKDRAHVFGCCAQQRSARPGVSEGMVCCETGNHRIAPSSDPSAGAVSLFVSSSISFSRCFMVSSSCRPHRSECAPHERSVCDGARAAANLQPSTHLVDVLFLLGGSHVLIAARVLFGRLGHRGLGVARSTTEAPRSSADHTHPIAPS